jgi:hypothetical protein
MERGDRVSPREAAGMFVDAAGCRIVEQFAASTEGSDTHRRMTIRCSS